MSESEEGRATTDFGGRLTFVRPENRLHRELRYTVLIDSVVVGDLGPGQHADVVLEPGEHAVSARVGAYGSNELLTSMPLGAEATIAVYPGKADAWSRATGKAPYIELVSDSPFVTAAAVHGGGWFASRPAPWKLIYVLFAAQVGSLAFAIYGDIVGGELANLSGYIFIIFVLACFIVCSLPWEDGFSFWEAGYIILPILGFVFAWARRRQRLRDSTLPGFDD